MTSGDAYKRAGVTLSVLCALYVVAWLDRMILALLVDPIRRDLGIDDSQMSLLLGAAFGLLFAGAGLIMGRLADTASRRWLVVGGVLVWSIATVSSGFAASFAVLILLRAGVGVGEAALQPAALSMISDIFPEGRRGYAIAVFQSCGLLGGGGAFLIGAALMGVSSEVAPALADIGLDLAPWRLTLVLVGLPGLALALAMIVLVREPTRLGAGAERAPTIAGVAREIGGTPAYALFLGGIGLMTTMAYGLVAWFPTLLIRRFDMSAGLVGSAFGITTMVMSVSGAFLFTAYLNRPGRDPAPTRFVRAIATAIAVGAASMVAATQLAATPWLALAAIAPAMFMLFGGAVTSSLFIQLVAPNRMRGQVLACYLLVVNVVGLTAGPALVALFSDALGADGRALGHGLALLAAAIAPMAVTSVLRSRESFARLLERDGDDWRRAGCGPAQQPS